MSTFPLLKIILVFAGVLLLNRLRIPLGLALLAGGIGVELSAGKGGMILASDLAMALMRPELWLLLANIALIGEVGKHLAAEDNSKVLIDSARRWGGRHGQALSLVMLPAAIGLVPMPGGALFSAPLVGETVKHEFWPVAWKAVVNYWFRHVMEYWWPLYPVVIVTLSIFTIKTWEFMAIQAPFTLVSIGAGYFFLLRPFRQELLVEVAEGGSTGKTTVFRAFLPVLLIVGATLSLPGLFHWLFPGNRAAVSKMLAMLAGLLASLGLILFEKRGALFKDFWGAKTFNMLMTLAGVMIFQAMLESSGLLPAASEGLARTSVPFVFIIAVLPFVAGLVTGIAIGFAGAAFPLVAGFVGLDGGGLSPLSTLVLAFSMGYAGMMLSPVHLCFVLTKEYFMAPFAEMYRYLLPCVATVMAAGVVLHILLRIMGW